MAPDARVTRSPQAPPRRARLPAAQRRTEILAAAVIVFGARGYHGASIDLIAREAGVSKALIYEHFASKRELHASLLAEHVGELFARLEANAALGASGEQRLRGGVSAFFTFVGEHREAFRLLSRDAADPEVAGVLEAVQEQVTGLLVALMQSDPDAAPDRVPGADAAERSRAVELLATQLSGAMQALAAWWAHHPEVPQEELVDRAADFAWTGLQRLREPVGRG